MTTQLTLSFDIRAYWHAGTGRGKGALVDSVAHKDEHGLPVLPGRTVKGLVRDAVYRLQQWNHLPGDTTGLLFGTIGIENDVPRSDTQPGVLAFSDAELPEAVRHWLAPRAREEHRAHLYREIHSTAIDPATGAAKDGSLRGIEVTVPLTLESSVTLLPMGKPPENWRQILEQALPLIQAVGASRTRGLGRVKATLRSAS